MAAVGGFSQPILHGLCTLGYAARHIEEQYPNAFLHSVKCRFVKHVYPGDVLKTRIWQVSPAKVLFNVSVVEKSGKERLVLSNAVALLSNGSRI